MFFRVLLVCLSISITFSAQATYKDEYAPSRWHTFCNYAGFGLSSELNIPDETKQKIQYGLSYTIIGVSELFLAEGIGDTEFSEYSSQNIVAGGLTVNGLSNLIHGSSTLLGIIYRKVRNCININNQTQISSKQTAKDIFYIGTELLAGCGLMSKYDTSPITIPKGIGWVYGLGLTCKGTYDIYRLYQYQSLMQKQTPINRMLNGANLFIAGRTINSLFFLLNPQVIESLIPGLFLLTSGLAELGGGTKDMLFVLQMILDSFKSDGEKPKEISKLRNGLAGEKPTKTNTSIKKPYQIKGQAQLPEELDDTNYYPNNNDSLVEPTKTEKETGKKPKIKTRPETPLQKNVTERKNKHINSNRNPFTNATAQPKSQIKSMKWQKARTQLKRYGIEIEDSAAGSRVKLTYNNGHTIVLHNPHGHNGNTIRGGRLQDVLYMLWIASQAQLED